MGVTYMVDMQVTPAKSKIWVSRVESCWRWWNPLTWFSKKWKVICRQVECIEDLSMEET